MKRRKKTLLIGICFLVFGIAFSTLYAKYLLNFSMIGYIQNSIIDMAVDSTDKSGTTAQPPIKKSNNEQAPTAEKQNTPVEKPASSNNSSVNPSADKSPEVQPKDTLPTDKQPNPSSEDKNKEVPPPTTNTAMVNTLQDEIDKPIAMKDLLSAGFIILKKLNTTEINFLFGFSNSSYSKEDLEKVRSLLLSKLSADEVKTLRTLGQKYDKKLEILDPNVPIK